MDGQSLNKNPVWWNKFTNVIINGFFGWENIKWFIRNLRATFSNEPSYFSRKRIESFMLFVLAFCTALFYIAHNIEKMDYLEMLAIIGALFVYAGYTMQVIQSEKKRIANEVKTDTNPDNAKETTP